MKIKELFEKYPDLEITEEQAKQIKGILRIKGKKKWRPKKEEKYYVIANGKVEERYNNNLYIVNGEVLINNCFKTKEEAEFRLEQIKVYNELKNFADENNEEIDWNNISQEKHNISYSYTDEEILTGCVFWCKYVGEIYFSSRELAEQAIEIVGADRIKKYLFGVE